MFLSLASPYPQGAPFAPPLEAKNRMGWGSKGNREGTRRGPECQLLDGLDFSASPPKPSQ